jgi:hypothetical protein
MALTYDYLKPYFSGDRYHFFYKGSVKKCKEFEPHSEGCFPTELIECRRPNEPLEVKDYRKTIWVPKTKPTFSRIVNSLSKIRRSPDWLVKHPDQEFSKIREGETLKDYSEKNFPYFQSVTNWIFSVCLKKYLTDPNGVVLVMPLNTDVEATEFLQPYPIIFDCCDVAEFVDEDHAILNDQMGCYYSIRVGNKTKQEKGKSYYVVDTVSIIKYDQVDAKGNYTEVMNYQHNLGRLPCFKLGGVICESQSSNYMYESRIAGILPELDEALREYSDLQAAKVLHVYPERWEYTSQECTTCKGTGRRNNPAWQVGCDASIQAQIDCNTCSGRGYIASGPYAKMLIKPADMGKQQLPTPPAGYVTKDIEIVKLMDDSVRQHIYDGLAAINFQQIASVPMNESGIAKAVDKDEQNNTVHSIAEDLVKIMDSIYHLNADYRYMGLYSFEDIVGMLPAIAVPEKFDLFSIANLQEDIGKAKTNKVNPVISNAMEVDYAGKFFSSDPSVKDMVSLTIKLDPLPGLTEDDKMSRLSNKGILPEAYIISSNINEFVQRALDEDKEFALKPLKEQKVIMIKYAAEVIEKLDTSKKIAGDAAAAGDNTGISVGDTITPKPGNGHPAYIQMEVMSMTGDMATVKMTDGSMMQIKMDQLNKM